MIQRPGSSVYGMPLHHVTFAGKFPSRRGSVSSYGSGGERHEPGILL